MLKSNLTPFSWEIAPALFLVCHPVSTAAAAPPKPEAVHHLVAIDVSGSMSGELPHLRRQVANRLATLLGPNDAISIVWFSGKGQCGILIEAFEPGLLGLGKLQAAVEQWLRPQGLTGFVEPLQKIGEVMQRAALKSNRKPSLFFMSDGCDNQWTKAEIYKAMAAIAPQLGAVTVVEYGPYADRPVLAQLAEIGGGALIYAEDFDAYDPIFEGAMRRRPAARKIEVTLGATEVLEGFAFSVIEGMPTTFAVDPTGKRLGVAVPDSVSTLYYLATSAVGKVAGKLGDVARDHATKAPHDLLGAKFDGMVGAYAALSLYAQRIKPRVLWPILRSLGDVRLIDDFSVCFGKQPYSRFVETTAKGASGLGWFEAGFDPERAPADNAFTILDLFEQLAGDPRCRILTESKAFQYSRIGRKSVTKDKILTVKEGERVAELAEELGGVAEKLKARAPGRDVAELRAIVAELDDVPPELAKLLTKTAGLRFIPDPIEAECGYPVDELVWNGTMPNLSVRVKKAGRVDLTDLGDEVPTDVRAALPPYLETAQFRAYTVVKDGLVWIKRLPVYLPEDVAAKLTAAGVTLLDAKPAAGGVEAVLDLERIPVINQRMILDASARDLAEQEWKLLELKARAKVLGYYAPERESNFGERFGAAAAAWLKEQGVGDGSFNPPSLQATAVDFTLGRSLTTKIPGLSGLPKVEETRERMAAIELAKADPAMARAAKTKPKELTAAMALMAPAITEVVAFKEVAKSTEADPQAALNAWLVKKAREVTLAKREVERKIARTKFALLIGGTWFSEFSSFDEKQLTLTLGGESRTVTFELDEAVKLYI